MLPPLQRHAKCHNTAGTVSSKDIEINVGLYKHTSLIPNPNPDLCSVARAAAVRAALAHAAVVRAAVVHAAVVHAAVVRAAVVRAFLYSFFIACQLCHGGPRSKVRYFWHLVIILFMQ